jgi:hypothetical protein
VTRLLSIARITLRLTGAILIVLGVLFWTGHALTLVPAHMAIGLLFVVALWAVAAIGARARVGFALVSRVAIWGALIVWFGMIQTQLLVGPYHWMIRVLHLVVGLIGFGLAEAVVARIRRTETAQPNQGGVS